MEEDILNSSLSDSYGGYGNIQQLGNYTNVTSMETIEQLYKNRENVLNVLIKGSYMPDSIIKCDELISPEKIKNKTKSEN